MAYNEVIYDFNINWKQCFKEYLELYAKIKTINNLANRDQFNEEVKKIVDEYPNYNFIILADWGDDYYRFQRLNCIRAIKLVHETTNYILTHEDVGLLIRPSKDTAIFWYDYLTKNTSKTYKINEVIDMMKPYSDHISDFEFILKYIQHLPDSEYRLYEINQLASNAD